MTEQALTEDFNDQEMNEYFNDPANQKDDASEVVEDDKQAEEVADGAPNSDGEANQQQNQTNDQDRFRAMAESERIRRKEMQKQIDDMRRENDQLKTTFNKILTKAQEQAELEQRGKAPSFEDDPIGALRYENEQLKQKMAGLENFASQSYETAELDQKQRQFVSAYSAAADQFAAKNPDFDDAYNFLMQSRLEEFEIAGYTPQQARQLIIEDEAAIAANALNRGANPAEAIYKLAQKRGYATQNAGANDTQAKINANNQKIAQLERGIQASRSVNSGGTNSQENLTLESIAAMDDDEFAKFDWNKVLKMG